MKTTLLVLGLGVLASACSYSHVGQASATFVRPVPSVGAGALAEQAGPLVLKISRHVDTILNGPDNEEDQVLVLEVHDFRLNQRLQVPSDSVSPQFTITRFGPSSKGNAFTGYLIVKKVTSERVDAYLHVDVTATTTSGSYTQTEEFHGDYTFRHGGTGVFEP
jgi:hypothetical protein